MPYARGRVLVSVSGGGLGRVGNAPTIAQALQLALGSWCRAAGDALAPTSDDDEPPQRRAQTARIRPLPLPPPRDSSDDLLDRDGDFVIPIVPSHDEVEALTDAVPLVEPPTLT
jgi:hypothetical protein